MKRLILSFAMVMGAGCAAVPLTEPTDNINQAAGVDDPSDGGDTTCNDPLLLDLRTGASMSSVANGASFDIDASGAPHRVAWPTSGGWLVLDASPHDGRITSGAELFGSASKTPGGLDSLAAYDANDDGVVDASDPVFAQLQVWEDKNRNGVSEPGELYSMADLGIVSLGLAFVDRYEPHVDAAGNQFRGAAMVTTADNEVLPLWGVVPTRKVGPGTTNADPICMVKTFTCIATCNGQQTSAGSAAKQLTVELGHHCFTGYQCGSAPFTASATSAVKATAKSNALAACDRVRHDYLIQWSIVGPGGEDPVCTNPVPIHPYYDVNPAWCEPSTTNAPTVSCQ